MLRDPVDCPSQSAHCRPGVKGDLERAGKKESLGQSRRERRLIVHRMTVSVRIEASALW